MPPLVSHLRSQLPLLLKLSFRVLLPIVVFYAVVAFQPFVPFSALLRDANTTPYDPQDGLVFYRGALSNVGILLWWAAAVVYAFGAQVLDRRESRAGTTRAFFIYFAAFTGLLALDDLFMIHEEILPVVLGVPEVVMYAFYGVLSAGLLRFVPVILRADFLVLVLAFGFFAVSILVDQIGGPTLTGAGLLVEDLSKMLGIVCWLTFATRIVAQQLAFSSQGSRPFLS